MRLLFRNVISIDMLWLKEKTSSGEPDKNPHHDSEKIVEEEKRIAPGCYVAMRLQKYCNEIPQIGRVLTIYGEFSGGREHILALGKSVNPKERY